MYDSTYRLRHSLSTRPSRALRRAASATIVGSALVAGFAWSAAAQAQAPCIDVTRPISVEEQRLPNKLNALNANPFAVDILGASGFTHFEQDFIDEICGLNGKVAPTDYNSAFARMTEQGTRLWRAAVDRVQGRKVTQSDDLTRWPTLAKGDDRPLYWARTTMTRALNRWVPMFPLSATELTALQLQLERTSRGQLDFRFPAGSQYKRMIVSGFDVFTLPAPGTNGNGMRNSNPSAATVLTLDGSRARLPDGTTLVIEAYILPVSYPPFALGMVEDTVGPWMMPGPMRVDASVSMSQGGGNQFWLEMWNGRFHGPTAGNDSIALAPCGNATNRRPQVNDCDVYPPERWMRPEARLGKLRRAPAGRQSAMATGHSAPVQRGFAADRGNVQRPHRVRRAASAWRRRPAPGSIPGAVAHQFHALPRLRCGERSVQRNDVNRQR